MKNRNYLIIDSSEANSDLFYRTNFFVPDPVIYLEHRGKITLVLNDLEYERGRSDSNADEVISYSECFNTLRKRNKKNITLIDIVDLVLKRKRIKSVVVQNSFPTGYCDKLRKLGYRINPADGPMLYKQRLIKSDEEVKHIKNALKRTSEAMELAINTVSKSKIKGGRLYYKNSALTSERLKGLINSYLAGCGYSAAHTIVACGSHSWMPHNTGSGVIYANRPIIIDIFPRSQKTGYFGDMTRTVLKGRPSDELVKMYDAVLEGQKLGIKLIKENVKTSSVHKKITNLFKQKGFDTGKIDGKPQGFIHSTGHGLGLEIHEPPRVGAGNEAFKAGNVVTVEPGLYYEKQGGIRLEDVVLVTKNGCKNLTKFKKEFVV